MTAVVIQLHSRRASKAEVERVKLMMAFSKWAEAHITTNTELNIAFREMIYLFEMHDDRRVWQRVKEIDAYLKAPAMRQLNSRLIILYKSSMLNAHIGAICDQILNDTPHDWSYKPEYYAALIEEFRGRAARTADVFGRCT